LATGHLLLLKPACLQQDGGATAVPIRFAGIFKALSRSRHQFHLFLLLRFHGGQVALKAAAPAGFIQAHSARHDQVFAGDQPLGMQLPLLLLALAVVHVRSHHQFKAYFIRAL